MPIKGLTDVKPSFPRVGILRKGAASSDGKWGADLNEKFRLDTTNDAVAQAFATAYPNADRINFYLPYASVAENFDAWVEHWVAGGLVWRGDGESLVLRRSDKGYDRWKPGDKSAPKQPSEGGKAVGRLTIIIPELVRVSGLSHVMVNTTSINDIRRISQFLRAYEDTFGSLQGIPFILTRTPVNISTPSGAKRVRRDKWLISIGVYPEYVNAKLNSLQREAMKQIEEKVLSLPMEIDDGEVEEIETISHFQTPYEWDKFREYLVKFAQVRGIDLRPSDVDHEISQMIEDHVLPPETKDEARYLAESIL